MIEDNKPRRASEADFPYLARTVSYFVVRDGKPVPVTTNKTELREVIKREEMLFAVWPGQWRSDLFVIDDIDQLRTALGDL